MNPDPAISPAFPTPEAPKELMTDVGWSAEIVDKVSAFELDHGQQLGEFNDFYKMYRAKTTRKRKNNQSNTFIPETTVEIEALATAAHEMIFSDSSDAKFFDIVGEGPEDRARAEVTRAVLSKQLESIEFDTKLLPFLRMLILHGTQPADIPWVFGYRSYYDFSSQIRKPAFDSWDFQGFNLINYSFDDSDQDTEKQEWSARTWHITPSAARGMVRRGIWSESAVDKALGEGFNRSQYDDKNRQDAGYSSQTKGEGFTAIEYFGVMGDKDDEVYWAWVTKSGIVLKEREINPFWHGEKLSIVAKWIALPDEPYGMGVGHVNCNQQLEINDRRNFVNDLLYASLYNMWLKSSSSGFNLPDGKMRWEPFKVFEADSIGEDSFRALRPDMSGLSPAIALEGSDRETMRRNSGATSTLQAIATGVTATESSFIQSEATRRLKATVRAQIGTFLKRVLYRAHRLNTQFLDRPLVARVLGPDGNEMFGNVSRQDLLLEPDIRVKISTDLDFRIHKRKELIELLNVLLTAQRGQTGANQGMADAVISEIATLYGMNPAKIKPRDLVIESEIQRAMANPAMQGAAQQQMMATSPGASAIMNGAPNPVGRPPMAAA